ncbi:MAG TPA: polynucleotide kinase-phosphatase [Gemmataceae bacterium]|nr:polynucleotide kinase-phosphatase [Gemmataceae bacterium]
MKLTIPDLSVVALVGPSGCGKSTFAHKHFQPTEILSSDFFRGMVCDDQENQAASKDAFELLHFAAAKRLARRRLTVIDATNVKREARKQVLDLARRYHYLTVAIVFNLSEEICLAYDQQRSGRHVGPHVVRSHAQQLRQSLHNLGKEGFHHVYILSSPEEVESAIIERQRLWIDRRDEHGPFDLIGDVHGCGDELVTLLCQLGYRVTPVTDADGRPDFMVKPPEGRKVIFVGDLVDRGPNVPGVLRLVMGMIAAGDALCVAGNHDDKLLRKLKGNDVKINHGLAETLAQLEAEPEAFTERVRTFLDGLRSHYLLDDGKLVVAHAGLKESLQGRASGRVRAFALYGETTGEKDADGLPVRLNWAADYRGKTMVVYGHTPVFQPEWLNHTINIDTGCVFGGRLTALRYPENELVSVPAIREYCPPGRAFLPSVDTTPLTAQQQADDMLDLADVSGKRVLTTRLLGEVTIRAENSTAALEVMSRFATDPRWLIYLPPTMSPCETSREPGLLEHPAEAFAYYRNSGVERVICQEKHMGSRAVVIVCPDAEAARRTFGVAGGESGIIYTRTGRRFFEDAALESELLAYVRAALDAAGFWERFQTSWVCLDCELMPWSAKAQELLRQQYAAVGSAARAALAEVETMLRQAAGQTAEAAALGQRHRYRAEAAELFTTAYRRYCWPVRSVADFKLAPFHLLATEGTVHSDKDHLWHMEQLAALCRIAAGLLHSTAYQLVEVRDESSVAQGVRWWEERTAGGSEGMVVKPIDFVVRGKRGLVQPAVKCRGSEYLRIIYGPEYTAPEHLERLRSRGLGFKRTLAMREFALGIEALERFVRREPLRRVHECCFGILALESEPVDPRL